MGKTGLFIKYMYVEMTEVAPTDFILPDKAQAQLSFLNSMRKNEVLIDVILQCNGKQFPAHKALLAASSPYFHTMFTCGLKETTSMLVDLPNFSPKDLEIIMEAIYTGVLKAPTNVDSLCSLMSVAHMMQMDDIYEQYKRYLPSFLSEKTYLKLWDLGDSFNDSFILMHVSTYLLTYVEVLHKTTEFLELSVDRMKMAVSCISKRINDGADVAVKVILAWLNHDYKGRLNSIKKLFSELQLKKLSRKFTEELIKNPLLQESTELLSEIFSIVPRKPQSVIEKSINLHDLRLNSQFQLAFVGLNESFGLQLLVYHLKSGEWTSCLLTSTVFELPDNVYNHKNGALLYITEYSSLYLDVNACIEHPFNPQSEKQSSSFIRKYDEVTTYAIKDKVYILGSYYPKEWQHDDISLSVEVAKFLPQGSWSKVTDFEKIHRIGDRFYIENITFWGSNTTFYLVEDECQLYTLVFECHYSYSQRLHCFIIKEKEKLCEKLFQLDLPQNFFTSHDEKLLITCCSKNIFIKFPKKTNGYICNLTTQTLIPMPPMKNEPTGNLVALTSWNGSLWAVDDFQFVYLCNLSKRSWVKVTKIPYYYSLINKIKLHVGLCQ